MPTAQDLSSQLDRAISDNFVNDMVQGVKVNGTDPIDTLVVQALDPNWQEHANHIFALLRYPEALEAVKLLQEIPRAQLAMLIGDSMEFIEIVQELKEG